MGPFTYPAAGYVNAAYLKSGYEYSTRHCFARGASSSNNAPLLCDNTLGPGWFRFQGDAFPLTYAGHMPRDGAYPEEHEGKVKRQVRLHWSPN